MGKCKSTCVAVLLFLESGIPGADPGFLQGVGASTPSRLNIIFNGVQRETRNSYRGIWGACSPRIFFFHFDVLWLLLGTLWDNNRMEAAPEVQMPPPTILYNCTVTVDILYKVP